VVPSHATAQLHPAASAHSVRIDTCAAAGHGSELAPLLRRRCGAVAAPLHCLCGARCKCAATAPQMRRQLAAMACCCTVVHPDTQGTDCGVLCRMQRPHEIPDELCARTRLRAVRRHCSARLGRHVLLRVPRGNFRTHAHTWSGSRACRGHLRGLRLDNPMNDRFPEGHELPESASKRPTVSHAYSAETAAYHERCTKSIRDSAPPAPPQESPMCV